MHEDHEQLDQELIRLGHALDLGDHMSACLQLAEFALRLDLYICREERVLATEPLSTLTPPRIVATVHREHTSLRQLVARIATGLDGADDTRCVDTLCKLRSVLLLHMAKEEMLLSSPTSPTIH
jgi:hypothetical protein